MKMVRPGSTTSGPVWNIRTLPAKRRIGSQEQSASRPGQRVRGLESRLSGGNGLDWTPKRLMFLTASKEVVSRISIPKGLRIKAQGCLPSEVLLTQEGEAFHDMPIQGRRSRDLYGVPALAGKSSELRDALNLPATLTNTMPHRLKAGLRTAAPRRAQECPLCISRHSFHIIAPGQTYSGELNTNGQLGCASASAWPLPVIPK